MGRQEGGRGVQGLMGKKTRRVGADSVAEVDQLMKSGQGAVAHLSLQVLGGCEGQDEGGLELKRGHRGNLFTLGEAAQGFLLAVLRLQSHTQIYLYFI